MISSNVIFWIKNYLTFVIVTVIISVLTFGVYRSSRCQEDSISVSKVVNSSPSPESSSQPTSAIYQPVYVEIGHNLPDLHVIAIKTKNWKTYKNKYFQFKYPLDWRVKDLLTDLNIKMGGLENTLALVGAGPASITYDVFMIIEVTKDRNEIARSSQAAKIIKEYEELYYLFNIDLHGDKTQELIYSTFRFN